MNALVHRVSWSLRSICAPFTKTTGALARLFADYPLRPRGAAQLNPPGNIFWQCSSGGSSLTCPGRCSGPSRRAICMIHLYYINADWTARNMQCTVWCRASRALAVCSLCCVGPAHQILSSVRLDGQMKKAYEETAGLEHPHIMSRSSKRTRRRGGQSHRLARPAELCTYISEAGDHSRSCGRKSDKRRVDRRGARAIHSSFAVPPKFRTAGLHRSTF